LGLNNFQALRSVICCPGENYADSERALVLGKGFQEEVDGAMRPGALFPGPKLQHAPDNEHAGIRRDHINMIRRDGGTMSDLADRHGSDPGQELGERAFMLRVEVLDEHEGKARVDRQMFEKLCEGFEPACRSAE